MPPPCCVLHQATKHAQHAVPSSNRTCTPSLAFLAPRLTLLTYLVADDWLKLQHWLQHYIGQLGVWPNRTHVTLRLRAKAAVSDVAKTLAVVAASGVPDANVRRFALPPSDAHKVALMNEHIRVLPDDEWHVYADVDELFDYACSLEVDVTKHGNTCITSHMYDQLASDGNITALTETPDLWRQYPLQCKMRERLVPRVMSNKYTLVKRLGGRRRAHVNSSRLERSRLEYSGTHGVNDTCWSVGSGLIRHYDLTAGNMENMLQKARLQRLQLANGSDPLSGLWTGCGNVDRRTGHCLDYELQYGWMEGQVGLAARATTSSRAEAAHVEGGDGARSTAAVPAAAPSSSAVPSATPSRGGGGAVPSGSMCPYSLERPLVF